MFDSPISAQVRTVKGVVEQDGDATRRRISVTLEKTFSDEVADGLGDSARVALRELRSRGLEKAVLPIDAISAEVLLSPEGKGGKKGAVTVVAANRAGPVSGCGLPAAWDGRIRGVAGGG